MRAAEGPFVGRRPPQGRERTHQAHSCSSGDPSAIRASGSRASRRPRGLRKRLHAVRDLVQGLPVKGREYAYASACVGPDLQVWAVPRHGEDDCPTLGLSLPRNSQNRPRQGLKGITPQGRKQVRWSCRLLEDMRRRLGMWTVTLTDEDYIALSGSGNWPKFQTRIHDLLVRHLKAHGDPALVVGVCEIGRKRFARTGRPDPHIHVITSGWGSRRPDGQWLLGADVMDELVAKACQYAGLPPADRSAASNIAPVRHSVASYMSKYLTKELPVDVDQVDEEMKTLLPRQWWFRSSACKAMVEGCLFKLPPAFSAFVVRNQRLLEELDLGKGGLAVVGWRKTLLADVPIELLRFRFKSTQCFQQALELFACWVFNDEQLDLRELVMSG